MSHSFIEAYSGLTLDRPKLNELRELIRANQIDVVVIYCLDRLSRDPTHGVILTQELERYQVSLEAVTETVDSTELGKLISYIRGFASKLEAEKIRERTMRGKMAYLKAGKLPQGTGIGIYGYNWDKTTGRRVIIDHEAETVRKIFNMALNGYSVNKIATTLNKSDARTKTNKLWHPLTVRRVLTNPTYTGKTYFGQTKRVGKTKVLSQPKEKWTLLPDVTPPTITEELFNEAQKAMAEAKALRPLKENSPYLLTGFIKCSKCGSPIGGTLVNGKYRYYQCRGAKPTATRGKICNAGYIKADKLEYDVWSRLVPLTTNPLSLIKDNIRPLNDNRLISQLNRQIEQLRKKLKTYPFKEKTFYELLAHDSVTKEYVIDSINGLKKERLNDEHQLENLIQSRKELSKSEHINLELSYITEILRDISLQGVPKEQYLELLNQRRNFLDQIKLKVFAEPDYFRFTFQLDGQIVTSTDDYKVLDNQLLDFEKLHPEITDWDLLDPTKQVPEDTEFGEKVNQLKQNLVTIEQTSASQRVRNCRRRQGG